MKVKIEQLKSIWHQLESKPFPLFVAKYVFFNEVVLMSGWFLREVILYPSMYVYMQGLITLDFDFGHTY